MIERTIKFLLCDVDVVGYPAVREERRGAARRARDLAAAMEMKPVNRRDRNREVRRAAFAEIAGELFLEKGFSSTSMSEISARMGGSKSTLWACFASKEDLFRDVIGRASDALGTAMAACLRSGDDMESTLVVFADKVVEHLTSPSALKLARLIASEVERHPELGPLFFDRTIRRIKDRLSGYLRQQIDAKLLTGLDPGKAARQLIALLCQPMQARICYGAAGTDGMIAIDTGAIIRSFLRAHAAELADSPCRDIQISALSPMSDHLKFN